MAEYVPQWGSMTVSAVATPFRINGGSVRQNTEITGDDSGDLYDEVLSVTKQLPEATFSTSAIKEILDVVGLTGQCVGSAFTVTDFSLLARAIGTCDDPLGATPHYQLLSDKGLLRLASLSASRGADASLSVTYDAFTDDGVNAPWAETDGVAAPSSVNSQRYRLGACAIAGVRFEEIDNVDISFNVGITDKEPKVGNIWPGTVGVISVRPVITLQGRDLAKVKTGAIELLSNAATHANTKFQLIRIEDGASYYSAASSEHIYFTMAGMASPQDLMDGGGGSRGNNSITIIGKHDGSNVPLLWGTSSTYDTSPES